MAMVLVKFGLASLIMPIFTFLFHEKIAVSNHLQITVLIFWPGSIVLMALGGSSRPYRDVLYIWGVAVTSNVLLYLLLGVLYLLCLRVVAG